jgi:uncharacterized protein (DUF1015 family)
MADIKPFRALRPHNEFAAQVASKPYDVLNSEEARKEAEGNLISFLHVTKSEIDMPAGIDIHTPEVYTKAKENLEKLIQNKVLFQDAKSCYYIYELGWKGRTQTGLVCLSSVDDYNKDVIKKHEFTRPEKEKDRIDHMMAVKAQTGNVFLACKDLRELNDVFDEWKSNNPAEYFFTASDGVVHTIWVVNTIATVDIITNLFREKIPFTYIADGHHRAASAAKVSSQMRDNPEAAYFLTTIFPANQLAILDYNRIVKDLNGLDTETFIQRISEKFTVEKTDTPVTPFKPHEFGMYLDHSWYKLNANKGSWRNDPVGILDVTILQENLLNPVLNVGDPRTDKRIDFVGGIRGLAELEKKVNEGEAAIAFSLYPVSIQQLFDIADSSNVMPPKTTWFEPKLRDGLISHLI